MKNDLTVTNIFDIGAQRYPHLKLTAEDFPRVLATRRIEEDDNAEYYGAMLPRTGVRILIDPMSMNYIGGASVDYVEDMMGGGFKIDNPNAVKSCGCGSSFSTEDGESSGGGCGSGGCGSGGCGSH